MDWYLFLFLVGTATAANYTLPRIMLIGPNAVGKSSLGRVLAGCAPNDDSCGFSVCHNINGCNINTGIAEVQFLGNLTGESAAMNKDVILVDTPGFGDADLDDRSTLENLMNTLKHKLGYTNTLLLCFEKGRWNAGILQMIAEIKSHFGTELMWKNVIIQITKWAFDSKSIMDRKRQNVSEEGTLSEINKKLKEHFHFNHSLPGVFIDSNAAYYLDVDEVQKEYFINYTRMLWEAFKTMQPLYFHTRTKRQACQIQNQCFNELLEERLSSILVDISNLNSYVAKNIIDIKTNTHGIDINSVRIVDNKLLIHDNKNDIDTNKNNIDTNKNNIDTNKNNIDTNTNNIDTNKNNIDTNKNNIDTNKNNIDTNKNNIDTNKNNIETNKNNIDTNRHDIATNLETIETLTNLHISQCGYRYDMDTTGTITYSKLETDVNSLKPKGGLDIVTGVFTAPIQGTYLVNINFYTWDAGFFSVYPYKNNGRLDNFIILSKSTDNDQDSSGRSFSIELDTDDTLHVAIYYNDGNIHRITFCTTLIK